MSAVYKALSKKEKPKGAADDTTAKEKAQNRQKVLILSSRGTTFRYALVYFRAAINLEI